MKTTRTRADRRITLKSAVGGALVFSMLGAAGAVGASHAFRVDGGDKGRAEIMCAGGLSSLSHVLNESASIFEGDPETEITVFDFRDDPDLGYMIEKVTLATHTGTHLDAPGHFIPGGRLVDELTPDELIMPAYVIDVRDRMAAEEDDAFQLTSQDIRDYERRNGRIERGSMVIIQTGLETAFGTDDYFADAPGFSAEAVQWLVDRRRVGGIGSDSFGPDATSDELFDATYTILFNDRVALPGLANLDSMNTKGDIIIISPIKLEDGSGYQVNPVACHSR